MPVSRRSFMLGVAAASAAAALPTTPFARASVLYPPVDLSSFGIPLYHGASEIRIGYASITWRGHDDQAIEDISSLGYPGIQLRANALDEFKDPHDLRTLLEKHHLKFVALSSGDTTTDPAVRQQTIDLHLKHAHYLHEAGGSYLQLIAASSKGQAASAEALQYQGELMSEIGKGAAEYGVQTGFHNHMGTLGQTPEAVDAILAAADPRYLKLELDTAHYLQGGGDPAAAIHKHGARLLFLHLKDVRNAPTKSGYQFVELGEGRLDFPAVFAALREVHFRGWAIVELDGERLGVNRTPKESAEISENYLEQKLGIHV